MDKNLQNDFQEWQIAKLSAIIDRDLTLCVEPAFSCIFAAYNRFQEDERDGVDYLFDINNNDDSACVIKGGMTIEELFNLNKKCDQLDKRYYFFGHNHTTPELVGMLGVKNTIKGVSYEIAEYVIKLHDDVEEYDGLYRYYESELQPTKSFTWICEGTEGGHSCQSNKVFDDLSECHDDMMRDINGKLAWALKFNELGFDEDRNDEVYETHLDYYRMGAELQMHTGTYYYRIVVTANWK